MEDNSSFSISQDTSLSSTDQSLNTSINQHNVTYKMPTRKSVDCVVIDKLDWKNLKDKIHELKINTSNMDYSSLLIGLAVPLITEAMITLKTSELLDQNYTFWKITIGLILLIIGFLFKKYDKNISPHVLEEKLTNIKDRILLIDNKSSEEDCSNS
ncbi:hypothetical protein [Clostridium paraputrificum]|uniref:hypothetical protein n=1 Tax=Clostridium paraputrificum TaxID=29363 RepID=UPI000DCFFACD|nr:hypothetical protein [Clostridium paraputrificum]